MANGERAIPFSSRENDREHRFSKVWSEELNDVFSDVARYYDRANHIATLGLLNWLRKSFVSTIEVKSGQKVLDVCAGTNAIGIALLTKQPDLEVSAIDRSEAMQEVYNHEYGLKSQILRYGHDLGDSVASQENPIDRDVIIVGFAGTVYGEAAWRSFLTACERINTEGRLPPMEIQIFGSQRFPYPHPGVKVTCQGWLPQREMLRRLAMVDFCYLPYWFLPSKRRHAQFSFPTKLTTYLAVGRPVLYHGPEYASITQTIRKYGIGFQVCSLDLKEIVSVLKCLIPDFSLRNTFSQAAIAAFHAEFNADRMMNNFGKLIGVTPDIF